MSGTLFLIQILNGLQLGVLLFLIAAGLTLVFGVMDFINLAHGVQYMLGAYLAVAFYGVIGNFLAALVLGCSPRSRSVCCLSLWSFAISTIVTTSIRSLPPLALFSFSITQ